MTEQTLSRDVVAGSRNMSKERARRLSDEQLRDLAREARFLVLSTAHNAKSGHIGGSLSAMDMLIALFFDRLRIDPERPDWPERDRFILSKGHCALALYTVMAMRGYFPREELKTFDKGGSRLQMHPDMLLLPGLDMSTGSLGQGLSAAVGMALGGRLKDSPTHVWAMLGDGELQEGMAWESLHVAPRYPLGNLSVIIDHNGLQQYGWPARVEDRGDRRDPWAGADLPQVLRGFGWRVVEIDGHDIAQIRSAMDLAVADESSGRPTAIIARTIKGKGVSYTESTIKWHTRPPTDEELEIARSELGMAGALQ